MSVFRPKVDYSLRPAKATVRRLIVDALALLETSVPISQYRYVGMGSIYFKDFKLIHRRLGVSDMITIEADARANARLQFNLPLACIDPIMEHTNQALPKIPLDERPHLVWLDYENRTDPKILSDVTEMVRRCQAGSIILFTVNADRPRIKARSAWLNDLADVAPLPEPSDPRSREDYAALSFRVLRAAIERAAAARNAVRHPSERVSFQQMFHLIHADGAQMLTVGGLIAGAEDVETSLSTVRSLEFICEGDEPFEVRIPHLTGREAHHLLSKMPGSEHSVILAAREIGIPEEDAKQFAAVYRYAPLFVEAEDW